MFQITNISQIAYDSTQSTHSNQSKETDIRTSQSGLQEVMLRLSSGLRVNTAQDDAAGLTLSGSLLAAITGRAAAFVDSLSQNQRATNGLTAIETGLSRLGALVNMASNDSSGILGASLNAEFQRTLTSIDQEASTAGLTADGQFSYAAADSTSLGLEKLDLSTSDGAEAAGTAVKGALDKLGTARLALNRTTETSIQQGTSALSSAESLSSARSWIADSNFAQETAQVTRAQLLTEAGTAVLSQANASTQGVLALLRGA